MQQNICASKESAIEWDFSHWQIDKDPETASLPYVVPQSLPF